VEAEAGEREELTRREKGALLLRLDSAEDKRLRGGTVGAENCGVVEISVLWRLVWIGATMAWLGWVQSTVVREIGQVGRADSAGAIYYSHVLDSLAFFFILSIFPIEVKRPNIQNTKYGHPDVQKFPNLS
jgi:hypothetical protein